MMQSSLRCGRYALPIGCVVLLSGATGFTGSYVVKRLLSHRVQVRAIVRPKSCVSRLKDEGVKCFTGSLHDAGVVKEAAAGVNYIFHLASPYRSAHASMQELRDVHIRSTEVLARAALAQPDFRRFVHVSTIGVHGHIEHPPADENYPFSPGDPYQDTKLEGELWLRAFGKETGLPIAVVRPAAIYGPADKRLFKLFKMATYPLVPLIGNGKCLYHLIHVEDLVDFMMLLATHPAAVGEEFICASKQPIAVEEIIRQVGALYGVKNRFVRIPVAPIMAAAYLCEWICKPLGIRPPLFPRRVAFFTKDRAFNPAKMTRLLGFETQYENRYGLEETARWYVENGWLAGRVALRELQHDAA